MDNPLDDFNFDLDELLDQAAAEQTAEQHPQDDQLLLPYVKVLQSKTVLAGHKKAYEGYVSIGRNVDGVWQGVLVEGDKAKFWIVDFLPKPIQTKTGKRVYQGARSMWEYDPLDGKRKSGDENLPPACKSPDGKAPFVRHLGKRFVFPLQHALRGQVHIIGTEQIEVGDNGELETVWVDDISRICETCPLGKWHEQFVGEKRISNKPLCNPAWNIPVYFPPQMALRVTGNDRQPFEDVEWEGGLAILQGQNPAVQLGLEGTNKSGKASAEYGERALPDLAGFHFAQGDHERLIEKSSLRSSQHQFVVGLARDEAGSGLMRLDGLTEEEKKAAFAEKKHRFALLRVKWFKYAKNGLPEHVGLDLAFAEDGMRYLSFEIVKNNWPIGGGVWVPLFKLHSDPVSTEDYGRYLKARQEYNTREVRDLLLLPANLVQVQQRLQPLLALAPGSVDMQQPADGVEDQPALSDLNTSDL